VGLPLHTIVEQFANAHKRLNGKGTVLDAVEYFVRHFNPDLPSKLPSEIVTEFMAAKKADGASRVYLKNIGIRLGKFANAFPRAIHLINSQEIDAWLRGLGKSPRTRNNYRSEVVTLFNFAQRAGLFALAMGLKRVMGETRRGYG
jgi:hypothetical protein